MPRMPLIVSFYTRKTPYEREIERLIQSCQRFDLEWYVEGQEPQGSWHLNCCLKGPFILECLHRFQRPVLWLDADAEVVSFPQQFAGAEFDFGAYVGRQLNSGTVYFSYSQPSLTLVERWAALCQRRTRTLDQTLLHQAYRRKRRPLNTCWLPQSYCKVFDAPWQEPAQVPVILHHQASRRFRQTVTVA